MKEYNQFYINGQWVDPLSSELIEVENPATEQIIGTIASGSKDDIDVAVTAARQAFETFSDSTKDERVAILESIIKEYEARQEELAKTISEEMGAPIWLSNVAQVTSGLGHFKDTLTVLKDFEFESSEGHFDIRKEPIGVIGMITPWN